ncbi:hypothetical protein T492DRAFT_934336 [Pavlovales sp. CCMP2436]|nr:hypothetical protein T492DRAFT_934336 [Pavlovales sp. CCMP2436]
MLAFVALVAVSLVRPNVLLDLRPTTSVSLGARVAAGTAFASALAPMVAKAAEIAVDNEIEYGSVSAPNFILPLGAGLAILTALLPVVMKGGDEAAREMQDRDADSFGKTMDSVGKKKR